MAFCGEEYPCRRRKKVNEDDEDGLHARTPGARTPASTTQRRPRTTNTHNSYQLCPFRNGRVDASLHEDQLKWVLLTEDGAAKPAGLLSVESPTANGEPEVADVDMVLSLSKLSNSFRTNPPEHTLESLQSETARLGLSQEAVAASVIKAQEAEVSGQEPLRKA
ncbi:hypothetical protein CONLIGDRAFT_685873 [Coniochaeta ligniaria NRRL 30616]|uniref:Uncharacterized protein n=1 Tax=Coniochaeta ligniaria NRRL 30616 TaxID=1408157 RepID=A0A1J7I9D3_9PEZI|nr:hypothetical protein CONLIGDRAFT_685873 [Coniochaeta ligniaria NRRL 30616]